jgi:hypothetical protein
LKLAIFAALRNAADGFLHPPHGFVRLRNLDLPPARQFSRVKKSITKPSSIESALSLEDPAS